MRITSKILITNLLLIVATGFNGCKEEQPIPPAAIASFSPTSGKVGETVTITGSFFDDASTNNIVKFNGVAATVTAGSSTELTVTVPASATTGKVTVSVRNATAISSTDFTVVPPVTISGFTPTSGRFGTVVTISGTGFDPTGAQNIVKINGVLTTVGAASSTSLTVTVPEGAGNGKITVLTDGETATSSETYTYVFTPFVSTLAGSLGVIGSTDGTGSAASFGNIPNIVMDSAGNAIVADALNHRIRKITPEGVVTTIAGSVQGSADGPVASATFNGAASLTIDAQGNIYICDSGNHTIRKISNGMVTTIAGVAGEPGYADGVGAATRFNKPQAVATDDAGNIFIADNLNNMIRKISPSGEVTTFAGGPEAGSNDGTGTAARFNQPWGIFIDRQNTIYLSDTFGNKIRKVTPDGVVTTIAGSGVNGSADGQGTSATFWHPVGISVDMNGNIYVADFYNYSIRKITPGGLVSTLAGSAAVAGAINGEGSVARFGYVYGVCTNFKGNLLYVADPGNRLVRKIVMR